MKQFGKEFMLAVIMGLLLPTALVWVLTPKESYNPTQTGNGEFTETTLTPVKHTMYIRDPDGTVSEMDMDTYLVGVVLAEMPADFEIQAKMAQAVVARTFTQKAVSTGGKHGDGSVCTDATCCQAYISESEYRGRKGSEDAIAQAFLAVQATSGYVLVYDGDLIEATYFSCSGGSTEDAAAVWGTDFPYLQATDSPGEEYALHYTDTVSFSPSEFQSMLGQALLGNPTSWFGMTTYTEGDGVASMEIGGKAYKGTELRRLLGLRSTVFSVSVEGDSIMITTRGFGHRVGMSQYGADAMAATGASYQEILAHYYQGTELIQMGNN